MLREERLARLRLQEDAVEAWLLGREPPAVPSLDAAAHPHDYVCECGVGHSFGDDADPREVAAFLRAHEHGDFRLTFEHPQPEADLTLVQRAEAGLE